MALVLELERSWLCDSLGEREGIRDEPGQISEVPNIDLRPTEVHKPHHQLSYSKFHVESDLILILIAVGEFHAINLCRSEFPSRT